MNIPLLNSTLTASVSAGDAGYVTPYRWYLTTRRSKQYAIARINGRRQFMHRHLMAASGKDTTRKVVDHINGNGLDNNRDNLRVCTKGQNMANSAKHHDRLGLYKGVHWDKREKKHIAQICKDGQRIKIGRYDNVITAAKAYDAMAVELFGIYARLNFPHLQ